MTTVLGITIELFFLEESVACRYNVTYNTKFGLFCLKFNEKLLWNYNLNFNNQQ